MHPNEGRPQGAWEVDDPPDPTVAQTSAEFAAELGVLIQWSQIPVDEIELRARAYGLNVPEGAVSEVLRGNSLPSEELLVEVLWAIGCDEETVGLWVWARSNLAANLAAAQAHFDPTEVLWVQNGPHRPPESALADAVQERGDQGGWRGLHRHGIPDSGDTKYTPKRLRNKESSPKTGWAMIALVAAGVLALAAGVVAALSGGDEVAGPPPGGQGCCPNSRALGSQTPLPTQADFTPMTTPEPGTSTKPVVNPTPGPGTTTRGPSPTPSQTQGQPPRLTGSSDGAACASGSDTWHVTVSVTAILTQAASGTNPLGRAGKAGEAMSPFDLDGSGTTTFSGQATIDAGLVTETATGTIQWTVTVTVPGGDTVQTSGSEGFNCVPASP